MSISSTTGIKLDPYAIGEVFAPSEGDYPMTRWRGVLDLLGDVSGGDILLSFSPPLSIARKYWWSLEDFAFWQTGTNVGSNVRIVLDPQDEFGSIINPPVDMNRYYGMTPASGGVASAGITPPMQFTKRVWKTGEEATNPWLFSGQAANVNGVTFSLRAWGWVWDISQRPLRP